MSRKSNRLPPCDGWPRFLSIPQGAYALGKGPAALQKLVRQGIVRSVRLGDEDFVEAESIRDLLQVMPRRARSLRREAQ